MSAVDAAVAVAETYGVPCDEPVVLREAWHVLVHLAPSPVVARVTSGALGVDPGDVERELGVALHAARAGAPVVRPSDLLPPGPHRHGGHTLVFWQYLGASSSRSDNYRAGCRAPSPQEYGAARQSHSRCAWAFINPERSHLTRH